MSGRVRRRARRFATAICSLVAPALVLLALIAQSGCEGAPPAEPLRTVGDMMRLPERRAAEGRPVELRGVVTLLDPDWQLLAVQDATGGVLVDPAGGPPDLRVGDLVDVVGATSLDNHVRSVVAPLIRGLGPAAPPKPEPVSVESLACGSTPYRLVEVEFRPDEGSFGDGTHTARFATAQPCQGLVAFGRLFPQLSPRSLVGRRIRVRGVPVPTYSPSGRIDQVRLMFNDERSVDILEAPSEETGGAGRTLSPPLSSITAAKLLPRAQAALGYPVRVEGIVTALNSRTQGYFLQDGQVGIFVASAEGGGLPTPGEHVRVTGRTDRGGYAPIIRQESVERLATGSLPEPLRLQPGGAFLGYEENVWVELEGVPTAVVADGPTTLLEISSGSRRLSVWFSEPPPAGHLEPLLDARVAVRGVYSPLYTGSGALTGFRIFTSSPQMLQVLTPPPKEQETRTIESIAGFDMRGTPRHRIRVSGSVSYRDTRGRVYLQDGSHALRVVGVGSDVPPLDARATAEGFIFGAGGSLQLEQVRWLSRTSGVPVSPARTAAETLLTGEQDGLLVAVEAYLEGRRTSGGELQLSLQAGRTRFSASLEAPGSADAFPDARPGALLRLTGICESRLEPGGSGPRLAALRLRVPGDLAVVRPAAWWDLRRALYAASTLSLLLVVALGAAVYLRQGLARQVALRSQLEEQLLHAQKLESIGRLAGGVAHDFNNYLTVILGYASLLESRFAEDEDARAQLSAICVVGGKAAALTRQLLAFSRKQVLRPRACDVNTIISDARVTLLPLIGEHIGIEMRLTPLERVNIDPDQFFQVLVNLAVNARDAMPGGGKLTLMSREVALAADAPACAAGLPPGRYARVSVVDTGVGMDEATRARAFEPFFTTKEPGRGTGLGLAVAFGIVKQSNGHIEVQSAPGKGTTFDIYFPVATSADAPVAPPPSPVGEHHGETILVVEDQDEVRALVRTALETRGYRVLEASRAPEALRLFDTTATPVHLILTDVVMPDMSGITLREEVARRWPGVRVLYMSGYSSETLDGPCLPKPFTAEEVATSVRRVLDGTEA